jgi:hypothetical protein
VSYYFVFSNSIERRAIAKTPSYVLFPPIKPDAWTNIQFGIPDFVLSSSSRRPCHSLGNDKRFSNDLLFIGTA